MIGLWTSLKIPLRLSCYFIERIERFQFKRIFSTWGQRDILKSETKRGDTVSAGNNWVKWRSIHRFIIDKILRSKFVNYYLIAASCATITIQMKQLITLYPLVYIFSLIIMFNTVFLRFLCIGSAEGHSQL